MHLIKLFLPVFCGALLAASSAVGYEKVEVLKDSKILQKTQAHQGQGVRYTDCSVEGRLSINTPELETSGVKDIVQDESELAARLGTGPAQPYPLGSRNSLTSEQSPAVGRIEIAPREEFTHTHHHLENRVEERSGPVTRSLKPAFKAALGVGVAALSVATGGVGSGIVGTLATTAITSSAVSFVNHGVESALNHESIDLRKILRDTGKSLTVAGLTMGMEAGLSEIASQEIINHSITKIALKSLAHYGIYRQPLIQTLAGQGISQAAALGASQIGQAYQDQDLNWVSHKLVHGALAMASTMSYGAITQDMNWSTALIAATAVMGAETAGDAWSKVLKDQNLQPQDGESKDDYIQRTKAYAQDWGRRSAACIRVLAASSLVLAGQDQSTILASDLATDTALEHNYWKMCTAITSDVTQGYLAMKEAWDEDCYWSAAGHLALTGASVALDVVTHGYGTQGVKLAYQGAKVGIRVGRRIIRGPAKKPQTGNVLKNEGKAPGEGVGKPLGQLEAAQNPQRKNLTRRKQHDEKHQDPKAQKLGTRFNGLKKEERVENFKKDHTKHDTGFVEEIRLPDGRIRKYGKEIPYEKPGSATRGSRMEAEYNPRTGNYKETTVQMDHNGQVIRAHPAFRNGQPIKDQTPHYPASPGDFKPNRLKNFKQTVGGKEVPLPPKVGDHLLDNNKYPAGTVSLPKKPDDLGGKR